MGHTPRSLRKVEVGEIMPPPFGVLHTAVIRNVSEMGLTPYGCRSSLTTLIGTTPRTQRPVKLNIRSTEEGGEPQHVIKLLPSSLARGLDERRVRLHVSPAGMVLDVSGDNPTSLFGFDPRVLVGRSLAEVVDVMRQPGLGVKEVLDLLIRR